ncbi:MAG TPA: hypothetical protein VGQ66_06000 [Candidatus Limnocylindria bacterium]|nr:hypothetical protein [Candidatus Limnocylindria bacterium]
MTDAAGSIRPARLTDRAALVALSRQVHEGSEGFRRSLGVPAHSSAPPQISLAALMPSWLPLRSPSVHMVAEWKGQLVGSCRAIEEPHRDDWVITELDATESPMASEVRFALLRSVIEEGGRRNVPRYHAACADVPENMELFGQLNFMAYAQEEIWYRPPGRPAEGSSDDLQPATPPDAWHLFDLWTHTTPPAIARIEAYGAEDWEPVGHEGVVPRSSLNPLLHFSAVSGWLLPEGQRVAGFAQHGACRAGPHYLRFLVRDGADGASFLRAVLGAVGDEAWSAGILAPVRTYESTGRQAAEAAGFEAVGQVSMLVREVRASARQPAMVPAV